MSSRVVVRGHSGAQYKEAQATGAIVPGMLVKPDSTGGVAVNSSIGPVKNDIAIEQSYVGPSTQATLGIDTPYASGDTVIYQTLESGAEFNGLVAANATAIVYGDFLESAGDGTVKKASSGGDRASVTVGGTGKVTATARKAGSEGNGISLAVAAASGGGTVVTTGTAIVVTPASAGDTAAAVVAQIQADAIANGLITVVAGGTTSASTGVVAATPLVGGADEGLGASKLVSRQTLDNSAVATTARLRAEVI